MTKLKFNIGDKVTYTNDYGVTFPGHKVIGIFKPDMTKDNIDSRFYKYGKRYFIDTDCHWSPVSEESLKHESI